MQSTLDRAFAASGAAAWGGTPFSALLPHMDESAVEKAWSLCPQAEAVLVSAYPYYAGARPGNLSCYARGEDYHLVLPQRMTPICNFLQKQYPGYRFVPGADSSPLPERRAALLAGIGLAGRNGLVLVPPYGSYVFLATLLTDAPLSLPPAAPAAGCLGCGACLAACPSGALGPEGVMPERCLSHLTQKKGTLSPQEAALVAAHPYAWGCDICQTVCPHNRGVSLSPLPEFTTQCIDTLAVPMLEGLTNRQFQAKFGRRAFAWRGPAVLRRNLALQAGSSHE